MPAIANSTWLAVSDEVLGLCRLRRIRTSTLFDSNPSQLAGFQAASKTFTNFTHQLMGMRATGWFATALIQLNIDPITPNATFSLDTGIYPEYLVPHSFFNVTNGNANARPLPLWSDREFYARFSDTSIIPSGPPEAVVLLPAPRQGNQTQNQWQVRIYPNPDANYLLQYKAKVNVPQLNLSTDQIFWPYAYQTQITAYTWMLMEMGLGEGKDGQLREVAAKAVADVKLVGTIAQEAANGIQMFRAGARNSTSRLRYWKLDQPYTYGDTGFWIDSPLDPLPTEISKLTPAQYNNLWGTTDAP